MLGLGWEWVATTNTLAFCDIVLIKCIVQTTDDIPIRSLCLIGNFLIKGKNYQQYYLTFFVFKK